MLPDAVDHDTRRQRILRAGNPVGELQASAPLGDRRLSFSGKNARQTARHHVPEPVVPPANVDRHIVNARVAAFRNAAFLQAMRHRNWWQWIALQSGQLRFQPEKSPLRFARKKRFVAAQRRPKGTFGTCYLRF